MLQSHTMRNGDSVTFTNRINGDSYQGTIYSIVNLPENRYLKNSAYVDYFYIRVEKEDLQKLLMRGLEVVVNHRPAVIGNIVREQGRFYKQNGVYSDESEIDITNINAILVWRVAFDIIPAKI